MKKKVTVVWGKFESDDFVLEPYVDGDEKEMEVLWIEKCEEEKW